MSQGPRAPFYVVGGTMTPGSPSYIPRAADNDLYEAVLAGEYCYVLTARQMGKSSLMARAVHRLRAIGVDSAVVDLTQIGGAKSGITPEQWYYGMAHAIAKQLQPHLDSRSWWRDHDELHPPQRLAELLTELVHEAADRRFVIFVDEIDATIDLPFSNEFFAAVRAFYNRRGLDPAFARMTFVLLGVSTPQDLIQDPLQTPFNIGRSIELTDFTPEEALPLAEGMGQFGDRARKLLQRVLHWTDGQPYLTQALCQRVRHATTKDDGLPPEHVDKLVDETYFAEAAARDDQHLKFIGARLTVHKEPPQLLDTYRRIAAGEPVMHDLTSRLHAVLSLTGVVKTGTHGRLEVRNRIYASVFTSDWAKQQLNQRRGPIDRLADTIAGRYRIDGKIGEGGMSTVFIATDLNSGTPIVLKRIRPDMEARARVLREASVLSSLRHPNIVRVYEYIEQAEDGYLVVEYLPGGSLGDRLARDGCVPEQQACTWCRDALRAVNYAHENGIVHRDLKPSNLMLDGMGTVKVTDFGVARIFGDERITRSGEQVGTVKYMSPEQIVSPETVYHSTDVYSMGVVLYELLTGRLPIEGDTPFALQAGIVRERPTPLRTVDPHISANLERIVLRALEKQPKQRYAGAGEFALALDDYMSSGTGGAASGLPHRMSVVMRRILSERLFKRFVK